MTPSDILRSQVGFVTTFDGVLTAVADALDGGGNEPSPVEPSEEQLANPDHPHHHRR